MSKKLELIVQIALALVIVAASLWLTHTYAGKFIKIYRFESEGVVVESELRMKGIVIGGELEIPDHRTLPSDNHQFLVNYTNEKGNQFFCRLPVSKKRYESHESGQKLTVVYLSSNPSSCMLESEIEFNFSLLKAIVLAGLFFALIGLLFIYYIYRQYRKPREGESAGLTTEFGTLEMQCPECGSPMTEGFIPTTGGITWRDKGESTGIPTIISGLPGTIFWLKRPKLHAFRCRKCKNVLFKHG